MDTIELIVNGTRYTCTPAAPEPVTVKPFSQRDPRWSGLPLGDSRYTVGTAGCAVVAVTMLATQVDPTMTPATMTNYLNTNGGFTSGGLLKWNSAAEAVDGLNVVRYHLWRDIPANVATLTDRITREPQAIQVDFYPGQALNTHFVVALSMTEDGRDINIIDPWTGERDTVLGAYGATGWTLARAVYAMAEFRC